MFFIDQINAKTTYFEFEWWLKFYQFLWNDTVLKHYMLSNDQISGTQVLLKSLLRCWLYVKSNCVWYCFLTCTENRALSFCCMVGEGLKISWKLQMLSIIFSLLLWAWVEMSKSSNKKGGSVVLAQRSNALGRKQNWETTHTYFSEFLPVFNYFCSWLLEPKTLFFFFFNLVAFDRISLHEFSTISIPVKIS